MARRIVSSLRNPKFQEKKISQGDLTDSSIRPNSTKETFFCVSQESAQFSEGFTCRGVMGGGLKLSVNREGSTNKLLGAFF